MFCYRIWKMRYFLNAIKNQKLMRGEEKGKVKFSYGVIWITCI